MKYVAVIAMVLFGFAAAHAQGMYWESRSEGAGGNHTEQNYAAPKMFKMVRLGGSGDGSVVIVRLDKKIIWMLHPEKKTYSEMTFDDVAAMAKKGSERMAAMKKKMKEMPEEQRKMMEKMMGGDADQEITVKKSGGTKTILGHTCSKLDVMRGETEFMTMWTAKDITGFQSLMGDWKEFSERMASMAGGFVKGMGEVYKQIDGFPMQTTVSMMGRSMTMTVTKIEKRSTPAAEFDLPSGYDKVKSPMENAAQQMDQK
jgi:hypothetical protein